MQKGTSRSNQRSTNGVGNLRAVSSSRLGTAPSSSKVREEVNGRLQVGCERTDPFETHPDATVLCPQATATMRVFSEWVWVLERNAYLRRLFPGAIPHREQTQVLGRIRRHFPEMTRDAFDKMSPREMVIYLKQAWEAEQGQSRRTPAEKQNEE